MPICRNTGRPAGAQLVRPRGYVGIPFKPATQSRAKAPDKPVQNIRGSERSDSGVLLIANYLLTCKYVFSFLVFLIESPLTR